MASFSSILAQEIPWTEEPSGLWSLGLQRAGHNREHTRTLQTPEAEDQRAETWTVAPRVNCGALAASKKLGVEHLTQAREEVGKINFVDVQVQVLVKGKEKKNCREKKTCRKLVEYVFYKPVT